MAEKDPSSWKKFLDIGKPAWWDQLMEDRSPMGQKLRNTFADTFKQSALELIVRERRDIRKLAGFDPMKGVPLTEAWLLFGHPNSREYVMDLRGEKPGSAELQNEEKEMKDTFKHWLTNWARSEMEHLPGPDGVVRECLYVLAGNDNETPDTAELEEIPWRLLVANEFDLHFSENALHLHRPSPGPTPRENFYR